jgi:RimJ/RimL family protein N-acetyltransferase
MREVLNYRLPDGTNVTLRPALPEDAAAVIATVRSSSEERSYVLMEVYGKDAAAQRAYIEQLDRRRNLFLVAIVGGDVVGILALLGTPLCGNTAYGAAVGVHLEQRWRGHGIGSAMLRYALRWAKDHGFRRVEADLFTRNERSVHLFGKAGFREVACLRRSVQVGAARINEVILAKNVP